MLCMSVNQDVTQLHKQTILQAFGHKLKLWNSLSMLTGRWKSLGTFPFGDLKGMAASVRKTSLKFDGIEQFLELMLWQMRILYSEMSALR